MDSYEQFFDQYVEFMKKYKDSGDSISMLADYTKMMQQYTDTMNKLNAIDQNSLSAADEAYYREGNGAHHAEAGIRRIRFKKLRSILAVPRALFARVNREGIRIHGFAVQQGSFSSSPLMVYQSIRTMLATCDIHAFTGANDTTMTVLFSAYNGGTFTAVVSPRENGALVKVSSENDDETQYMQHVKQFFQDVDAQLSIRAVAQKSEAAKLEQNKQMLLIGIVACVVIFVIIAIAYMIWGESFLGLIELIIIIAAIWFFKQRKGKQGGEERVTMSDTSFNRMKRRY